MLDPVHRRLELVINFGVYPYVDAYDALPVGYRQIRPDYPAFLYLLLRQPPVRHHRGFVCVPFLPRDTLKTHTFSCANNCVQLCSSGDLNGPVIRKSTYNTICKPLQLFYERIHPDHV